MRREQRKLEDYQKYRATPLTQDFTQKNKMSQSQLRSLECSSVHEAYHTNEQSDENSWIEKLVGNIDDEKYTKKVENNQIYTRNFARKANYDNPAVDKYARQTRTHVTAEKGENKYNTSPFDKISQFDLIRPENSYSKFPTQNYQRIIRKYDNDNGYQKYKIQRSSKKQQSSTDLQTDLNSSYGKIKRVSKVKETIPESYVRAQNYSKYSPLKSENEVKNRRSSIYEHQQKNISYQSLKRENDQSGGKRQQYGMVMGIQRSSIHHRGEDSTYSNYEKDAGVANKQRGKRQGKQDEVKIDQMAKKLNLVLESITKKSKLLQSGSSQEISLTSNYERRNSYQQLKQETKPKVEQAKKTPVTVASSYPQQKRMPVTVPSSYERPIKIEKSRPIQTALYSHQDNYKTQKSNDENRIKCEQMKKSLGMSKHVPHEIILEQSSSELNSQNSPRTQFLTKQLRIIFDKIDIRGNGEINKNNSALENLRDQIKFLFGPIFSRIKYKNQSFGSKAFIFQCQAIVKQFNLQQLRDVLAKKDCGLRLQQKDTDSVRWNNDTNNDNESKRSSERSEVVKKYEFADTTEYRFQQVPKVHWSQPKNYQSLLGDLSSEYKTKQISKTPENIHGSIRNINNSVPKKSQSELRSELEQNLKQKQNIINSKQKISQISDIKPVEVQKDKKDFDKMCEKLNSKLNTYLTNMGTKTGQTTHQIPLSFSELSKHWNRN